MVSLYRGVPRGPANGHAEDQESQGTNRALQADYLALDVQSMMFTSCHGF
jgi:hypothetical protein